MFVPTRGLLKTFALLAPLALAALLGSSTTGRAADQTLILWIQNDTGRPIHIEYRYSPNHPVHEETLYSGCYYFTFTPSNPDKAQFRIKYDSRYGRAYVPVDIGISYWGYYHFVPYSYLTYHDGIKLILGEWID